MSNSTAVNNFDDTLPVGLTVPASYSGHALDATRLRQDLARCLGWYRKESAERLSPRQQRDEAGELSAHLRAAYAFLGRPDGLDPTLRALLQEKMRHLGVAAPDFARLIACVEAAARELPEVRRGASVDSARLTAARSLFASVRRQAPRMTLGDARALSADLLCAVGIPIPSDDKELRKLMPAEGGGN